MHSFYHFELMYCIKYAVLNFTGLVSYSFVTGCESYGCLPVTLEHERAADSAKLFTMMKRKREQNRSALIKDIS